LCAGAWSARRSCANAMTSAAETEPDRGPRPGLGEDRQGRRVHDGHLVGFTAALRAASSPLCASTTSPSTPGLVISIPRSEGQPDRRLHRARGPASGQQLDGLPGYRPRRLARARRDHGRAGAAPCHQGQRTGPAGINPETINKRTRTVQRARTTVVARDPLVPRDDSTDSGEPDTAHSGWAPNAHGAVRLAVATSAWTLSRTVRVVAGVGPMRLVDTVVLVNEGAPRRPVEFWRRCPGGLAAGLRVAHPIAHPSHVSRWCHR
jgi:hypothetical protein